MSNRMHVHLLTSVAIRSKGFYFIAQSPILNDVTSDSHELADYWHFLLSDQDNQISY